MVRQSITIQRACTYQQLEFNDVNPERMLMLLR